MGQKIIYNNKVIEFMAFNGERPANNFIKRNFSTGIRIIIINVGSIYLISGQKILKCHVNMTCLSDWFRKRMTYGDLSTLFCRHAIRILYYMYTPYNRKYWKAFSDFFFAVVDGRTTEYVLIQFRRLLFFGRTYYNGIVLIK